MYGNHLLYKNLRRLAIRGRYVGCYSRMEFIETMVGGIDRDNGRCLGGILGKGGWWVRNMGSSEKIRPRGWGIGDTPFQISNQLLF